MCDPTLGIATGVAALSAYAKYQQNRSEASAYDAQAKAYSNQAHQQIQQGSSEAYQQTREARSAGATQNAIIGTNGVVSSTGSALGTLSDTFQQGQQASDQILTNAYNQAETTQYQGNIARASAKNTRSNNLASSLLTGVSTFGAMGGFSGLGAASGGSSVASQANQITGSSIRRISGTTTNRLLRTRGFI